MGEWWEVAVAWAVRPSAAHVAAGFVAFLAVLAPLERLLGRARAARPRRSVLTDVAFWAVTPLATKAFTFAAVAATVGALLGDRPGFAAVRRQPFWLQFLQVAALGDLLHYWSHRLFHRPALWPMHAVHHSPTHLGWLSAMRLHPLNDLATRACQAVPVLALGYRPEAVALYVPLVVAWVVVSHADLPWTFGPLRHVLVSPALHHWHHSSEPEALDKNFAGIFAFWDVLFGTYHLPAGRRPGRYGVAGPAPPEGVVGLLLHPLAAWAAMAGRRVARRPRRGGRRGERP